MRACWGSLLFSVMIVGFAGMEFVCLKDPSKSGLFRCGNQVAIALVDVARVCPVL